MPGFLLSSHYGKNKFLSCTCVMCPNTTATAINVNIVADLSFTVQLCNEVTKSHGAADTNITVTIINVD